MAQELIAWFGSKQKPLNATSKSKSRARTKSYPTVLLTNKLKHHQPIKKFQNVKASHALERIMGRRERERARSIQGAKSTEHQLSCLHLWARAEILDTRTKMLDFFFLQNSLVLHINDNSTSSSTLSDSYK
jgi:hypothetical protein